MEDSVRKALSAPFPAEAVKNRRGNFGKPISYVEGNAVIARLNDCFGGEWSFSIVEHHELAATGEVLVLGRLTVLSQITKEAFGKSAPPVNRETGEVLSAGDAYKAAATDALKKAATMLGVALSLYSDDVPEPVDDKSVPAKPAKPNNVSRDRLTQKQLQALWNLSRTLNLDSEALRKRSEETFGVQPEQLSKVDASALISKLGEEIDKRRAA